MLLYTEVSFMISFHASPVTILKRVKAALGKFLKLACTFSESPNRTSAKRKTPRIEYRYIKSTRSPPTLASSGIATINVLMIFYSSFSLLMILMILAILKDLMIVDTAPTSMLNI